MLLALTLCGLDSLRTAQKKRGAFASRCTMPKVQVLVMAATAATVKTSTAMEAFAAMKPSATKVLATAVAHGAARDQVHRRRSEVTLSARSRHRLTYSITSSAAGLG